MLECEYLIVGAGESGLFLAQEIAKLGFSVILIEQARLGGSYMYSLDQPRQLLLKEGKEFSTSLRLFKDHPTTFSVLLKHRQKLTSKIQSHIQNSVVGLTQELSKLDTLEIITGQAEFVSKSLVEVNSQDQRHLITFKNCLICTGKNEMVRPDIDGIENLAFLFQHNVFLFEEIPSKLAIIGCTLENLQVALLYADLGVKVEIFEEQEPQYCTRNMDRTGLNYIFKKLLTKQAELHFHTKIIKVEKKKSANATIKLWDNQGLIHEASHVFVWVKEAFDDKELHLAKIAVKANRSGISTDKFGRTSQRQIWAFGEASNFAIPTNKYAMLKDFVHRLHSRKIERKAGHAWTDMAQAISINQLEIEVKAVKSSVAKIDGSNSIVTLGLTEIDAIAKFGPQIKSKMWQVPYLDGFAKLIYKETTDQLVSLVLAGEVGQKVELAGLEVLERNGSYKDVWNLLEVYSIYK